MWSRKKLTELNPIEFYQILKLRIDTFVVEQERIYHELDDKDLEAVHVFHTNKDGEIEAYARVFEEGEHSSLWSNCYSPVCTRARLRRKAYQRNLAIMC